MNLKKDTYTFSVMFKVSKKKHVRNYEILLANDQHAAHV